MQSRPERTRPKNRMDRIFTPGAQSPGEYSKGGKGDSLRIAWQYRRYTKAASANAQKSSLRRSEPPVSEDDVVSLEDSQICAYVLDRP